MLASKRQGFASVLVLALALLSGQDSHATLVQLSDRASVAGNDHVHWGHLGAPGTVVSNSTPVVQSFGGIGVSASMPGLTQFSIHDQVAASSVVFAPHYSGDFAVGDAILAAGYGDGAGPLRIVLASVVSAIGLQVDPFFLGGFSVEIEAFNTLGASLGSFVCGGTMTANADGSALFVGVGSNAQDIASIELSLVTKPYGGSAQIMAINGIDFRSSFSVPGLNPDPVWPEGSQSVPEPTTLALALVALKVALLRRRTVT